MTFNLYVLLTFLTIGFTPANKPPQDSDVAGIWIKYNGRKVVEIFITRPNHQFVSDLFDEQGYIKRIEKGNWNLKGNSIFLRFPIQLN